MLRASGIGNSFDDDDVLPSNRAEKLESRCWLFTERIYDGKL